MATKPEVSYIVAPTKKNARIRKALEIAVEYGGNDGAHHKDWVIDQMVRALTGCPMIIKKGICCDGRAYSFEFFGENEEYLQLIADACDGEDGPDTYSWSTGIAP